MLGKPMSLAVLISDPDQKFPVEPSSVFIAGGVCILIAAVIAVVTFIRRKKMPQRNFPIHFGLFPVPGSPWW
jgi:hypothetical protein